MNRQLARWLAAALVTALPGVARAARTASLSEAQRLEQSGRYRAAAKVYRALKREARAPAEQARALLGRANALFLAGKEFTAYEAYRELLESYPLHVPYDVVLGNLRTLAEGFAEGKGTTLGIRNRTLALEIYELITRENPTGKRSLSDHMRMAQLQRELDLYEEAAGSYRALMRRYGDAPEAGDIRLHLVRLLLGLSREGDGDGSIIREAERELLAFRKSHPDHPQAPEAALMKSIIEERQATDLYELGQFYLGPVHRRIPAARRYLSDVVHNYPDTLAATLARNTLSTLPSEDEVPEPPAPSVPVRGDEGTPEPGPVRRPETEPVTETTPEAAAPTEPATPPPPKTFPPLQERDRVSKWLRPLDDLNDLGTEGAN